MSCSVSRCTKKMGNRKLYCEAHYYRIRRTGELSESNPVKDVERHERGIIKTPEYKAWNAMKNRCENPSNKRFIYYGGRGIAVCSRWRLFKNFFSDMGKRPTKNHSLDRINNDLDYSTENCRWATSTEQKRNRRCVKLSVEKATEIRKMYSQGVLQKDIADTYKVNQTTISDIILKRIWKTKEENASRKK